MRSGHKAGVKGKLRKSISNLDVKNVNKQTFQSPDGGLSFLPHSGFPEVPREALAACLLSGAELSTPHVLIDDLVPGV